MPDDELGLHTQGSHNDEGNSKNTLEQCHNVHVFVLVIEQILNFGHLGGCVQALGQRQQGAQQLLGSGTAVDESHQGLGQADGQFQITQAHLVAQLLLVAQGLGVILDGIAAVAHLEHDVSLLAEGIDQIGHRGAGGVGVAAVEFTHI